MKHHKYLAAIFSRHNQTTKIALTISVVGILIFLAAAFTLPFQAKLFNTLFPKPTSQAAGLNLTVTINSIGIEVPNEPAAAGKLRFKKSSDANWRDGLDMWQTGGSLYGSVLLAEPGTSYDVEVTPAGGQASTGTVTTRSDTNSASLLDSNNKSTLAPTHCVDSNNGNDSNNGQAVGGSCTGAAAWKTLSKAAQAANAATSDMTIQVAGGYYSTVGTAITPQSNINITFVAEYPAADNNGSPINAGKRAVIEPRSVSAKVTSPQSPNDPNPGKFDPVTLTGPGLGGIAAGGSYKVYKWTGSPGASTQLGFSPTRDGVPLRVAHWDNKGASLSTPEGWAELMYTNATYRFGFFRLGTDIYLRLPVKQSDIDPVTKNPKTGTELDPDDFWVFAGGGDAFNVSGSNVRISGFEIKEFTHGVLFGPNSANGTVDHNYVVNAKYGVRFNGDKNTTPSKYGTDYTIENNRFADSGIWETDPNKPQPIPWTFIKLNLTMANNVLYGSNRVGEESETNGVYGNGFARRAVVRNNTIDGYFNGVGAYNANFDRYASQDTDVYNNVISHIADDALEPEQVGINWRVWGNKISDSSVMLSTGPLSYGPLYFFKNQVYNISAQGVGLDKTYDLVAGNEVPEAATVFFKYSGTSNPNARLYVLNNTFWSNYIGPSGRQLVAGTSGGEQIAGGGPGQESFYLRNNIIRTSRHAFVAPAAKWDENYNYFSTSDISRGFTYAGTRYFTVANLLTYRNNTGFGANTNKLAGVDYAFTDVTNPDTKLTAPANGDLTQVSGSPFVDSGVSVANISDISGFNYSGSAPDLGACEGSDCLAKIGGTGSGSPTPTPPPSSTPAPSLIPSPTPSPTPAPSALTITSGPTVTIGSSNISFGWVTNTASSSKVEIGLLSGSFAQQTTETDTITRVTNHTVTIPLPPPCVTLYYRARSRDAAGNFAVSNLQSFNTGGCSGSSNILSEVAYNVASASGGIIDLLDAKLKGIELNIPSSYAGSNATFQMKKMDKAAYTQNIAPPSGQQPIGDHIYRLDALTGLTSEVSTFNAPIKVTIKYDSADLTGIDTSTLKINRFDGTNWQALSNCTVDTSKQEVSCETSRFSDFALMGEAKKTDTAPNTKQPSKNNLALPIIFTLALILAILALTPHGRKAISRAHHKIRRHKI